MNPMLRNNKRFMGILAVALVALTAIIVSGAAAQEEGFRDSRPAVTCPDPDPDVGSVDVTLDSIQPRVVTNAASTVITVLGTGFKQGVTIVAPAGLPALETTVVTETVANAVIPAGIAPGEYRFRLNDARCGAEPIRGDLNRTTLTIQTAPQPTATFGIIEPPEPPTPLPGAPSLLARNFSANPPLIPPGGTTTLTFEVVNQGNRTAEGVVASVDAGSTFVPAGGQASVTLPNIFPGGSATVSLSVVASGSAEPGPTSVPITITYRDFTGESYSSKAALSVSIDRVTAAPLITLSSYTFDPDPVQPGKPVTVTVEITNSGSDAALQGLMRITGDANVLLAGPQGDSFPLGDIPPNGSVRRQLTMIVSTTAKAGPQPQPFTVSFFQKGEAKEVTGTMTVDVAPVIKAEPIMLLESYEVDKDPLAPGETFNLSVKIKNVGTVSAQGILVTFGTVESSGGTGGDDDNGTGGSTTSTTPSNTFAPLGSGGTLFLGDLGADGETSFEQPFIVSGSTVSGIYSLPITLRYQAPDGSAIQNNLRASVVVIAPPTLRFTLLSPIPDEVNIGEPLVLSYEIANTGTKKITLTNARAEAENGETVEGAETLIGDVQPNDQTAYNAVIIPSAEGEVKVTITFGYKDDLNKDREIVEEYVATAVQPPPPVDPGPPIDLTPEPNQPEEPTDILGRLLLGLLGLGS